MLTTIRGLEDGAGGIDVRVRVMSLEPQRRVKTKTGEEHIVVDAHVGDGTGSTVLSLWDEKASCISVGDVVDVKNGYARKFRGLVRLNVGKYGSVEKAEDKDFPSIDEIVERQKRRRLRRRTAIATNSKYRLSK